MSNVPTAGKEPPYFAYIDGLRAVSIIAVVLFHLDPGLLPGGFAGVDVFFAVSGFIISGSLHERPFSGPWDLFSTFYARRLRRIVPAMLFMLVVTCALAVLFIPSGFYLSSEINRVASAAFLGFSNVRLASGFDYFFPRAEFNPFTHTWSLAVEEQFYILFPLLYFLLSSRRTAKITLTILIVLCGASFAYGFIEPRLTYNLGFYSGPARFWEIGSGVLLYVLLAQLGLYRPNALREFWPASCAGALLLLAGLIFSVPQSYPVPGAALPVAGALCLIAALHGRTPTSIVGRALTAPPILLIGVVSYSLYLWHWPVFSLLRWTIGFEALWQKAVALVLAFAMTFVSYRYVEAPLRYADWLRARQRAIPIFLAAIALAWWGGDRLFANAKHVSASLVTRHRDDWFGPSSPPQSKPGECRAESQWWSMAGIGFERLIPRDCANSGSPALFAVGDSHALAYRPMLVEYARRTGAPVTLYAPYFGACAMPPSIEPSGDCAVTHDRVIDIVGALAKPGDVVFLPALRVPRIRTQWDTHRRDTQGRRPSSAELFDTRGNYSVSMLRRMTGLGLSILFELPKPIFGTSLFRCADWFNRMNPACEDGTELDRAFLQRYREPIVTFASALEARVERFSTWDPFPVLCPGDVCSMWRNGHPLFFDGDHVTYFANTLLADDFISSINALPSKTLSAIHEKGRLSIQTIAK